MCFAPELLMSFLSLYISIIKDRYNNTDMKVQDFSTKYNRNVEAVNTLEAFHVT